MLLISLRELIPSLVNTLRKWYSTVRGLMKSRAPMSALESPSTGELRDQRLLGRELSARLGRPLPRPSARGEQLALGAAGERVHPHRGEPLVSDAQLGPRVESPALASRARRPRAGDRAAADRLPARCGSVRGAAPLAALREHGAEGADDARDRLGAPAA